MADRTGRLVETLQLRHKLVSCKFETKGSGVPELSSSESRGVASVARSDTGKYLITLRDAHRKGLAPSVMLHHSSDTTDLYCQCSDYGNLGTSSATTLTVRVKKGSANTDVATGNYIRVVMAFEDSSEA